MGSWAIVIILNLEDQMIFVQGFLPLGFDEPTYPYKAAVAVS